MMDCLVVFSLGPVICFWPWLIFRYSFAFPFKPANIEFVGDLLNSDFPKTPGDHIPFKLKVPTHRGVSLGH